MIVLWSRRKARLLADQLMTIANHNRIYRLGRAAVQINQSELELFNSGTGQPWFTLISFTQEWVRDAAAGKSRTMLVAFQRRRNHSLLFTMCHNLS
jgi:hypothetical protein